MKDLANAALIDQFRRLNRRLRELKGGGGSGNAATVYSILCMIGLILAVVYAPGVLMGIANRLGTGAIFGGLGFVSASAYASEAGDADSEPDQAVARIVRTFSGDLLVSDLSVFLGEIQTLSDSLLRGLAASNR
jgi:hypothetical protein